MVKTYLEQLFRRETLTREEAAAAMSILIDGTDPHQAAAFLALLKYRGETADELTGMVDELEKRMIPLQLSHPVLDIVGTGGDGSNTVNISTGSAILAAACGIPVAKIGNRSVSSRCGSADVLEALGIEIEIPSHLIEECIQAANIAFMYAPHYHPAFKQIAPIRKGLKLPTVFNLLGPLLNPARAEYALIGVANAAVLEMMSEVIVKLGTKKSVLVFHGNGLDELSTLGPIQAYEIREGKREALVIDPQVLGFNPCSLADLQGGEPAYNAAILQQAFAGSGGAVADALVLNAGVALWIFDRALTIQDGIAVAREVLQAGKALKVLHKWKQIGKDKQEQNRFYDKIAVV